MKIEHWGRVEKGGIEEVGREQRGEGGLGGGCAPFMSASLQLARSHSSTDARKGGLVQMQVRLEKSVPQPEMGRAARWQACCFVRQRTRFLSINYLPSKAVGIKREKECLTAQGG